MVIKFETAVVGTFQCKLSFKITWPMWKQKLFQHNIYYIEFTLGTNKKSGLLIVGINID